MIEKITYIAFDGKEFSEKNSCEEYENKLKATFKMFKVEYKFNFKTGKYDNVEYFCVDCGNNLNKEILEYFLNKSKKFGFDFPYDIIDNKIVRNYYMYSINEIDFETIKPIIICSSLKELNFNENKFKEKYLYDENFLKVF